MIDDQAKAANAQPGGAEPSGARDRRARDEAAAWYGKMSGQRVSNADLAAFFAWRENSLNDAAYTRIEALTTSVRALADDPRLQAIAETAARRPRGVVARLRSLGQGAGLRTAGVGAALVAAMVIGAVLLGQVGQQTYRTQIGERRAVSLDDGSTIELNTNSQVRVRLSKTQRSLILDRGQAMFIVAHDAARPFVVTAGDTSVRAIGTRFEVYRAAGAVRVTLAEGRVQVSKAGRRNDGGGQGGERSTPVILNAGQRVDMAPAAPASPVAVDVAAVTGWTRGRLTFKDASLAEAVAEVNRYSRRQVVLGPGTPADQRVNGEFDAGDTETFARGMAVLLDLKTVARPDGGIELAASPAV
ncbi:FecR family protein [Caulobacter vibrioides]|uniref:Transcriptional regulator, putative n=2 Tax=Caulobacter vibrioides TaxID=155892 RepID=Q9A4W7_CAUVC|nr:FecR family protein [Caulobacter vibrioides]YP_002518164.1 FecR family protein [Caulobacter vibrioides NA1000]AAK24673.1 transcriptional regulator, putative [Caulobacter vibrioides CB15]ACL96256.1 FecR family protein [Caulobacter vibrioides NA1000]ATC29544.1 FecR family protein [Caulobacter vibrioides]AZH13775.1 FecR family protein [Caulobacter vibrioides]QXZ51063.1 FecR family protein [Caulobacter vibrioides]